jgi:hypothetical protein
MAMGMLRKRISRSMCMGWRQASSAGFQDMAISLAAGVPGRKWALLTRELSEISAR